MDAKPSLVLVGNGMAGVRTIEELLKLAPERYAITVFGAQSRSSCSVIVEPSIDQRLSSRSTLALRPRAPSESAPGSIARAQMSSSCSRGAVAPRISVRPVFTRSAARATWPDPNRPAWSTSRWILSTGARTIPRSAAP